MAIFALRKDSIVLEEEMVVVGTAPNAVIAAAWRELLWQEGIVAWIRCDDPLASAYLVTSPYPCDVLVRAGQAEQARAILANLSDERGMQ